MTRLPQLHRELMLAAEREEEQVRRLRPLLRLARRPSRVPIVLVAALLASTTIALAATGMMNGSAVPGAKLDPRAGVGAPIAGGGSKLLPLRVQDPQGGLPWGMRVVRTTRGETCIQVGRVKDGRLGELGVDGAFHDDGEFHLLPATVLPDRERSVLESNANTSCALSSQSLKVAKVGLPASASGEIPIGASAVRRAEAVPRKDLRNVYFGLLGPRAVSVSYESGGEERTQRVIPELGAYLLVQQGSEPQTRGSGGQTAGTGLFYPGPREPLTKFTYRIDGKLCARAAGAAPHLAHRCPAGAEAPKERGFSGVRRLRVPLRPHLDVRRGVVTGLTVSFRAPFAVKSAGSGYSVMLPQVSCHHVREAEELGGTGFDLDRDVRKGGVVSAFIAYPFRVGHICARKEVEVDILYRRVDQAGLTIIGKAIVKQPPNTRNGARPKTHR